ncbi:MAG TPA: hypothetical protein VE998_09030 [Terriglobales bacterium]|nr:hypothetical protein [Terriglobales bacterium]
MFFTFKKKLIAGLKADCFVMLPLGEVLDEVRALRSAVFSSEGAGWKGGGRLKA